MTVNGLIARPGTPPYLQGVAPLLGKTVEGGGEPGQLGPVNLSVAHHAPQGTFVEDDIQTDRIDIAQDALLLLQTDIDEPGDL